MGTAAAVRMGYPILRGHGPTRRQRVSTLVHDDRFGAGDKGPLLCVHRRAQRRVRVEAGRRSLGLLAADSRQNH